MCTSECWTNSRGPGTPDGQDVGATGFQGIFAKRRDSLYESGTRTGAWVKYKVNRGQEFVIGGYTPGNPFDALIVGYYEGGRLLYAAKVRNGFVPLVRREVARQFEGLEIDTDTNNASI